MDVSVPTDHERLTDSHRKNRKKPLHERVHTGADGWTSVPFTTGAAGGFLRPPHGAPYTTPPPFPKGPLFFKYLFYIFHLFLFPYAFFHCPVRILLEKILLFSLSLSLSFLYLLCRSLSISLWERRHSGFLWAERPFLSSHMECCRSFRLITLERGSIYRRCSPKISPLSLSLSKNEYDER